MKLKRLIAAFFILALNFAIIGRAYSEPIIFAQVNNPTGIVVDNTGSVFVQSLPLPEFGGSGLLKFDANGNLMAQNNQLTGNFRLALDSASNIIWAQEMNGILYSVDPDTLLAQPVIDLRAWIMGNILQSQAFNILTGMPDTLVMVNPVFGDIATWQSGAGQLDVLVTGLTNTSGGMPFVLRLSLNNGTLQNPQIVVTSLPSAVVLPPPLDTFPSGLAINSNGTVLAPLPIELDLNSAAQATQLFLSIFGAEFPTTADASTPNFIPAYGSRPVFATGMTASNTDNGFFATTIANGFGCGSGPAVLHFPSTLDNAHCILDLSSLGLTNTEPADIAIDPNNQFLYVTMPQDGSVLRLDPPSLPVGNAPLQPSETSMLFGTTPLPPSDTSPLFGTAPLPPSEP
jgi:hypothetical protein